MNSDSNLPPGVNVWNIPGNTPEDAKEDVFWEALDANMKINYPQEYALLTTLFDKSVNIEDAFVYYINEARLLAYEAGYNDARNESDLFQAYKEEQEYPPRLIHQDDSMSPSDPSDNLY